MSTWAILNARTVDEAYRVLVGKDPKTDEAVRSVNLRSLASALHYLETSIASSKRLFDPTVPNAQRVSECGNVLAWFSGCEKTFILSRLHIDGSRSLETSCAEAIDQSRQMIVGLTHEEVLADSSHSPLPSEGWETVVKSWRRDLAPERDVESVRDELSHSIIEGKRTYRGSKCVVGLLGPANTEVASVVRKLMESATDEFLRDHLIPVLIDRFRLQFLPLLGSQQDNATVALSDPRLADLASKHCEYAVRHALSATWQGTDRSESEDQMASFKYLFESVPLGLLALLSVPSGRRKPDRRRIFDKVVEFQKQMERVLLPASVCPGQLMNELSANQREALDAWLTELALGAPIEIPFYCRVIKYATPVIIGAAGAAAGSAGGPVGSSAGIALGGLGGIPVGDYLAELANPHRDYNIAVRNFQEIQAFWSRCSHRPGFVDCVRAKVRSVLGLEME